MIKKKKFFVGIITVICILMLCVYRYHNINQNVARTYEKHRYKIGQKIKLDKLEILVKDFKFVKNNGKGNNSDVILDINIKNISGKVIDASPIVEESNLAVQFQCNDYADVIKGDLKRVKNLSPKEEVDLTLRYSVLARIIDSCEKNSEIQLYIPNVLYKNQIINEYKKLKLYSKYVFLYKF